MIPCFVAKFSPKRKIFMKICGLGSRRCLSWQSTREEFLIAPIHGENSDVMILVHCCAYPHMALNDKGAFFHRLKIWAWFLFSGFQGTGPWIRSMLNQVSMERILFVYFVSRRSPDMGKTGGDELTRTP
jgi:hypothetical protein